MAIGFGTKSFVGPRPNDDWDKYEGSKTLSANGSRINGKRTCLHPFNFAFVNLVSPVLKMVFSLLHSFRSPLGLELIHE